MATKKGSKSSKTAHVLNVLSGVKQEVPIEEEKSSTEEPEAKANAADVAVTPSRPPVRAPILEMARANDEVLSEQIQHLLEEDWKSEAEDEDEEVQEDRTQELPNFTIEEERPAMTQSPLHEISSDPIPSEQVELVESEITDALRDASQEPAQQAEERIEPPKKDATTIAKEEAINTLEQPKEEDFCPVNVMQILVDEKCMRYVKMFGMCACSRCVADVKALALTNLMPKYLVMRSSEVVPMLTVYERRFNAAVTAQLISACKVVMDYPRH